MRLSNCIWEEAGVLLADAAARLEQAGADFLVIGMNTMHIGADQIARRIGIPILHVADPTATMVEGESPRYPSDAHRGGDMTVEELRDWAILGRIVECVEEQKRFCGETLSTMEGLDVVQTVPHEWGATYRIGRRYGQVRDRFPKTMQRLEPAIDWVMRELAPLGVKELEPLATALFLKREQPEAHDEALAARLHEIKPHVSVDAARAALQKVGGWMAERA